MATKRSKPHVEEGASWSLDGALRVLNDATADGASRAPLDSRDALDALARRFVVDADESASTLGVAMSTGVVESRAHTHRAAHLFYLVRGDFTCEASGAWWIVPPGSALWVPGGTSHRIRAHAPLEGYNVFLDPGSAPHMPRECCAVTVTPLLREIVLRLGARPVSGDREGTDARLVAVLLDELTQVSTEPHRLPMPSDPRLRTLVDALTKDPSQRADMKTWAKRVGVAERTLHRIMVGETGLSFGRWRQQLHIIVAVQRLSRGASVQRVASELGYESAASFVAMFRKAVGQSPARYVSERSGRAPSSARA